MHEVRRCVHLTCQHLSARCKRIQLSVHSGLFSELIASCSHYEEHKHFYKTKEVS